MAEVIVYSSDTCPYCVSVKDYLKENDIAFTERNISQDKSARIELVERGLRGVPVVIIDGTQVLGFDQPKIAQLLNLQ